MEKLIAILSHMQNLHLEVLRGNRIGVRHEDPENKFNNFYIQCFLKNGLYFFEYQYDSFIKNNTTIRRFFEDNLLDFEETRFYEKDSNWFKTCKVTSIFPRS